MKPCAAPASGETLRDYFAGDLGPGEAGRLEDHVFACDACAAAFDREGAMSASLRAEIPPVITHDKLAELQRAGLSLRRNVIAPGAAVDVRFSADLALLINALAVRADDADRVDLTIADASGRPLVEIPAIPYDRGSGEVLLACQRRYEAEFPPRVRFELTAVKGTERKALGTYVINHLWEH